MKYVRLIVSAPILALGAMFLGLGIVMLMASYYIGPDMKLFDGWIDRMIDGTRDDARHITPGEDPMVSPRLAA